MVYQVVYQPAFNQTMQPRRWSTGRGNEDDLFALGRQTGFCSLGTRGGPGFRIPDIFPFYCPVESGILIIAHGK